MATHKLLLALSEHDEQVRLCKWMEMKGIEYFACPNGGKRDVITAAKLKREGVKAGAPDIVVVTRPPNEPTLRVVIEMKKKVGAKYSGEQLRLHEVMRGQGWLVIAPPAGESASWVINYLIKLGY